MVPVKTCLIFYCRPGLHDFNVLGDDYSKVTVLESGLSRSTSTDLFVRLKVRKPCDGREVRMVDFPTSEESPKK